MKRNLYEKLIIKLRGRFLDLARNTPFQYGAYASYWHYRLQKIFNNSSGPARGSVQYIAQKPNYSAGIGHQLANWNAGYYFAGYYQVHFAHFPFSGKKWEALLGFGENETTAHSLLKDRSFKKRRLPRFNSEKKEEITLIANIIASYKKKKVFFLLEQDQGYMEQCGTAASLSKKFFMAAARQENKLFYDPRQLNIAIHIRRGDIVSMKQSNKSNWEQRWLNNDYYAAVLKNVLAALSLPAKTAIYIFSQGHENDFPEFKQFNGIHYCLDVNAYDSFVHLVYADILISSKSSFSYKPALISKGIKICPADFWHRYPGCPDFILAADDGNFDGGELAKELKKRIPV